MNVTLKINKIKNIDHAEFELPLEKGLYAFMLLSERTDVEKVR